MFELSIQREFRAAHALAIRGEREPSHHHDWQVTVIVEGPELDEDGLLCDFHDLERRLDAAIGHLHGCDLNATPPFDRVNPTAEHVARHIAERLGNGDGSGNGSSNRLPGDARLVEVSVTEAPGCRATFKVGAS